MDAGRKTQFWRIQVDSKRSLAALRAVTVKEGEPLTDQELWEKIIREGVCRVHKEGVYRYPLQKATETRVIVGVKLPVGLITELEKVNQKVSFYDEGNFISKRRGKPGEKASLIELFIKWSVESLDEEGRYIFQLLYDRYRRK